MRVRRYRRYHPHVSDLAGSG